MPNPYQHRVKIWSDLMGDHENVAEMGTSITNGYE